MSIEEEFEFMQALLLTLVLMVIYGLLHSLLAGHSMKRFVRILMGERAYLGLYRLLFNAIATITFLPVLWAIAAFPGDMIWEIGEPWNLLLRGLQLLGIIGLLAAFSDIDGSRFLGLRQAAAWWNGDPLPLPPEKLQLWGTYRIVRHPLYLFSLMLIWPTPAMTSAWFGFCFGSTIYMVVGSLLEEQRMMSQFGAAYEDYRKRVPWLLPFVGGRT